MESDRIAHWIDEMAEYACTPQDFIFSTAQKLGAANPSFDLRLTAKGLTILETTKNNGFVFPKDKPDESAKYFSQMENLFLPSWALEKIFSV